MRYCLLPFILFFTLTCSDKSVKPLRTSKEIDLEGSDVDKSCVLLECKMGDFVKRMSPYEIAHINSLKMLQAYDAFLGKMRQSKG